MHTYLKSILTFVFLSISIHSAQAAEWSETEIQYQYGNLDVPTFAGGGSEKTNIVTIQYINEWKYGGNFFFADIIDSSSDNGFNDADVYAEWYPTFSFSKISGKDISFGPFHDASLILGFNWGADVNVKKYLPGVRFSWNVPGFIFFNTDFMAYIDGNDGVKSSGAPKTDNGFMFDVSWAYPFQIGSEKFSFEGHAEYLTSRKNELGFKDSSWILAQPQIQWYITGNFSAGIEYQYWNNKLGDKKTDESTAQLLLVYTF